MIVLVRDRQRVELLDRADVGSRRVAGDRAAVDRGLVGRAAALERVTRAGSAYASLPVIVLASSFTTVTALAVLEPL